MSKLYTEEQVRKAWNTAYVDALSLDKEYYKPIFYDDFIASLNPIQLPTDEESAVIALKIADALKDNKEVEMSNKKQSSVDVLFEILWETPKDKWEWNAVLKEVKELHKEEMRELYLAHVTKVPRLKKIFEKQFEEYYNETFGGDNE